MKKIIALLLALVMVLGLVACGAKEAPKTEEKKEEAATSAPAEEKKEETKTEAPAEEKKEETKTEAPADDKIQVAFLTAMAGAESWQVRLSLIPEMAAARNMEVTIIDCDANASLQSEQMESAIEAGYDAIIVSPAETAAIIASTQKAIEAGIPVISCEGVFDGVTCVVGIHEYDTAYILGTNAGKWMNENYPEKTSLNVMDMNYEFLPNCIDRNTGFMDGLKDHCNAEIVVVSDVSPTTTAEATTFAESALQADDIDLCMSTNGDFLYGFFLACENLGIDTTDIVGFTMDCTPASLDYLIADKGVKGIGTWGAPADQVNVWLDCVEAGLATEDLFGEPQTIYNGFIYIDESNAEEMLVNFGWA